jgi:hypothetical protein
LDLTDPIKGVSEKKSATPALYFAEPRFDARGIGATFRPWKDDLNDTGFRGRDGDSLQLVGESHSLGTLTATNNQLFDTLQPLERDAYGNG